MTRSSRRASKKGKSKLATSESQSQASSHHNLLRRSSNSAESATPRRRPREDSRSSKTLGEVVDGQEECRFEARFNASGLDPSTASVPLLDSSQASSSSTRLDDDDDDDDDEESDSESLHDIKGNPLDNSPYAQVRSSVAATDNTSLSIDTPRMWFLSIMFAMAGSSTNLFFSLRYPSVSLTPIIALLLVHPLGLLWDQLFKRSDDPEETFLNGSLQKRSYTSQMSPPKATSGRSARLWLAQGRWNEKEHCCVYVSSNVSFGFAFATDVSYPAT